MQILIDDSSGLPHFYLLDLDFFEIVSLTDAMAYWMHNKQAPCADTVASLSRAVEIACESNRDRRNDQ